MDLQWKRDMRQGVVTWIVVSGGIAKDGMSKSKVEACKVCSLSVKFCVYSVVS